MGDVGRRIAEAGGEVVHVTVGGTFAIEVGGAFVGCGDESARIVSALGIDPIGNAEDVIDDVTQLVEEGDVVGLVIGLVEALVAEADDFANRIVAATFAGRLVGTTELEAIEAGEVAERDEVDGGAENGKLSLGGPVRGVFGEAGADSFEPFFGHEININECRRVDCFWGAPRCRLRHWVPMS